MKKISLIIVAISFISLKLSSQAMYAWANHFGGTPIGTQWDEARVVKVDNIGNVYIAGTFYGTADFDPGVGTQTITSAGAGDGFIAKYNSSGNFLAVYTFSNNLNCKVYSIDLDNAGNIFATGNFNGTVDFDPSAAVYGLSAPGSYDIFVLKINANGTFAWAKKMGDASIDDCGLALTADNNGDVLVTGYFSGNNIDFDPGAGVFPLSASAWDDAFVLKLTTAGVFSWAFDIGTSTNSFDRGQTIISDLSGNVFVGGYFQGTADFDPSPSTFSLVTTGVQNGFIAKYTIAGVLVWAKAFDGICSSNINALSLNANGNIYSVGSFTGNIDADPGVGTFTMATVNTKNDVFVSQLNATGNFVWAGSFNGPGDDLVNALSTDATGIYIAGSFSNTVDFNPGISSYTLSSAGYKDFFLTKLDLNGNHLFSQSYGNNIGDEIPYGIATPSPNLIYVGGSFYGTVDFNPSTFTTNLVTATGGVDAFLLKLDPCIESVSLSTSSSTICSGLSATLSASGSNTLLWNTGATGSTIVASPTITTNYSVTGSFTTGCVDTKTIDVQVVICAAMIEEISDFSSVVIYPNPNNGDFVIEIKNQFLTYEIYNLSGQLLYNGNTNENSSISLKNYSKGIYLIKLNSNKSVVTKKIIIN